MKKKPGNPILSWHIMTLTLDIVQMTIDIEQMTNAIEKNNGEEAN